MRSVGNVAHGASVTDGLWSVYTDYEFSSFWCRTRFHPIFDISG